MSDHDKLDDHVENRVKGQRLAAEATIKAKNGLFEEAIHLLNQAIELDSNDHRYFNNRCWCHFKTKQIEKALSDAQESITLNPFKWKSYFNKGRVLVGLKRYSDAERSFRTAKGLAGFDCKQNFDEEIRKVKYLESIKECMDPSSGDEEKPAKNSPQEQNTEPDNFLDHFWNQTTLY